MKPLALAYVALFAASFAGCDSFNTRDTGSISGRWAGSSDYTPAGGEPIHFNLDLQLMADLDSLSGSGTLEVENTSFSDGSYSISVTGNHSDSTVFLRFDRVILRVLSGYDGRWSADSIAGQITTTSVANVRPEPIWLNLHRR